MVKKALIIMLIVVPILLSGCSMTNNQIVNANSRPGAQLHEYALVLPSAQSQQVEKKATTVNPGKNRYGKNILYVGNDSTANISDISFEFEDLN